MRFIRTLHKNVQFATGTISGKTIAVFPAAMPMVLG
ncbi:Uncharacterised protein [Vibrio cholerae]|nr:Uncharacterised protein [Vibrio cholerae]CSI20666.1 Uncharacterised protein [Vibrio cholerae]CSI62348.1 Uncharacterised protein [Vibrio cholerae]